MLLDLKSKPLCAGEGFVPGPAANPFTRCPAHHRNSIQLLVYRTFPCYAFLAVTLRKDAVVVWEGDSKDVISRFPDHVKENLGYSLRLLQQGEEPVDYRSLGSVEPGLFELRDEDKRGWYRLVYLSRIENTIYVIHCFEKKTREIPKRDLETIRARYRNLKARLKEHRKHAKTNR